MEEKSILESGSSLEVMLTAGSRFMDLKRIYASVYILPVAQGQQFSWKPLEKVIFGTSTTFPAAEPNFA
jgi:hypothetical protein